MDNVDKELHRLSKINPNEGFIKASKARLLHQIQMDQKEGWFRTLVKKAGLFGPSASFLTQARTRLMTQIRELPQPFKIPLRGFAYFLNALKKAVASTLVMLIAVTAVLFQVEGGTVVEASNDSYLETLSGSVSISHAGTLTKEKVTSQVQLRVGDRIHVEAGGQAVIHFFDDTQVRLEEDTTLLISHLDFSPAFSDQGIIETSLEQGKAWVQTLNVEDGYAAFTLQTQEAVLNTFNSSFAVESRLNEPAEMTVFNGTLNVSAFAPASGQLIQKTLLTPYKTLELSFDASQTPILTASETSSELKQSEWVQSNLKKDELHLTEVREMDSTRLTGMAGTLPGDLLYPIKQVKELIKLEWGDNSDASVKIEIANNRLNEAMVLLKHGELEKGQEALSAYQSLTHEILTEKSSENQPGNSETLITQLVVPHQKILASQPTDKNSIQIKETLQKTAETLAQNPLELETIRLKNAVSNLQDIRTLVEKGEVELAKENLAKYKTSNVQVAILDQVKDEVTKRESYQEVLDLRQEENDLLALVSEKTSSLKNADKELMAMVVSTSKEVATETDEVRAAALPLIPELAEVIAADQVKSDETDKKEAEKRQEEVDAETLKAIGIADKINIYAAWNGQFNQILLLLGDDLEDPSKIDFLTLVQTYLTGRAQSYLGIRILQLQNELLLEKEPVKEEPVIAPTPEEGSLVTPVPEPPVRSDAEKTELNTAIIGN